MEQIVCEDLKYASVLISEEKLKQLLISMVRKFLSSSSFRVV